jgi:heat shock protein HslJ
MRAFRVAALIVAAAALTTAAEAQFKGDRGRAGQEPQYIPPAKREKQFPVPSRWIAISLNGKAYGGLERPSFTLDQQYRARGFGGCNNFEATAYPLREQRFAVGPLALTRKQCDKAVMDEERAFFVALRTAVQFDLDGAVLIIKGQNGELRFERSI